MGGSRTRIVGRHIVPNAIGDHRRLRHLPGRPTPSCSWPPSASSASASQPPQTDWGSMLSNGVNYAFQGYWWEIYPAGLCIVLVVVAFNFIGDALRDSLEVRLQRR